MGSSYKICASNISNISINTNNSQSSYRKASSQTSAVDQYIKMIKPWDNEEIPDTNIEELEKLLKDIFD